MSSTLLTRAARIAIATSIKNKDLFLAVAAGDEEWGPNPPFPSINAIATTTAALAFKRITHKVYCAPDPVEGTIVTPSGAKFKPVFEPTEHLYLKCVLEADEVPQLTYRELAIFMDSVMDSQLPPGQNLFMPADVVDAGTLVALQRRDVIIRQPEIREIYHTVITI